MELNEEVVVTSENYTGYCISKKWATLFLVDSELTN
jgi:hypothetical protein